MRKRKTELRWGRVIGVAVTSLVISGLVGVGVGYLLADESDTIEKVRAENQALRIKISELESVPTHLCTDLS